MDNFQSLQNLVNSLTYKPGARFILNRTGPSSGQIQLLMAVPNVHDPEITVEVAVASEFRCGDGKLDVKAAKAAIYNLVLSAEVHEAQEFLRYEGKSYIDPHIFQYTIPNQGQGVHV